MTNPNDTVASARNDQHSMMHCLRQHHFRLSESYTDAHGTWCPECGNSAHTGFIDSCKICQEHEA